MIGWIVLAAILLVILGGIGYFVSIYNGLILLKQNIEKSWSNIDVLLKQRHDEVPNLVATVKGYMEHEKSVFEEVTKARTAFQSSNSVGQMAAASGMMTQALGKLFAVAEAYPELKANENFLALQSRISELEDHIADRREFYNDSVTQYNIRIQQIPDVFVANMLKLTQKELFKVEEVERNPVEVQIH